MVRNVIAGSAGIDQEERDPVLCGHCGVRDRGYDGKGGAFGAGREPFVTVDDPATIAFFRVRPHQGGIGAGAGSRFRHCEARARFASGQRFEVLLLLFRGGGPQEKVHVAFVGSGTVQRQGPKRTAAGFFEDHTQAQRFETQPAELARQLWRPEPGLACLAAHGR